jgi:hypothetical protein
MTIAEALRASKENGQTYACPEMGGWIVWKEGCVYRIPVEALLSDAWEMSSPKSVCALEGEP